MIVEYKSIYDEKNNFTKSNHIGIQLLEILNDTNTNETNETNEMNTISMLIQQKANVNICDTEGNTPLMLAIQNLKYNSVDILLKNGAEQNHKNKNNET